MNINVSKHLKLKQKMKLSPQMIITAELLQKPIQELELALKRELHINPFLLDLRGENPTIEVDEIEDFNDFDISDESTDLTEKIQEINKIINDIDENRNTKFNFESRSKSINTSNENMNYEKEKENIWHQFKEKVRELAEYDEEIKFVETFLSNLNKNGFLEVDLAELADSCSLELKKAEEIQKKIMNIYPKGIGAHNLQECLIAQLDKEEIKKGILPALILYDLKLIQNRMFNKISKKYKISLDMVKKLVNRISHLDPKPATRIFSENLSYICPDVKIKEIGNNLEIIINDDFIPEIGVNKDYAKILLHKSTNKKQTINYIKSKLLSAENFVKAVWMRRNTLYKITKEIIRQQPKFFKEGIRELKPMTYEDIANCIDRDISTVSRVVNGKYIDTPYGILQMRWFFSSRIGNISSQKIRKEIKKIIDEEDKSKPLSDKKIVEKLAARNIKISQRAVTKYRNKMCIPISRLRKK